MRAYIVKPGTVGFEFTEESVESGKGKQVRFEEEEVFTEVVMDPIRYSNGHQLNPECYPDNFANRILGAARLGWSVFIRWNDGNYVAVPYSEIEVR